MVAGHIGTFELKPGRRDEFLAVMAAMKAWQEGHGAVVWARANVVVGPESGRLSLTALFQDPAARGAYFDAIATEVANSPMGQMVVAADPPATPISRVLFNEIGESSGISDSPPLQMAIIYAQGAGQAAEAEAALQATKERWAAVGLQSRTLRTLFGGSTTGRLLRVTGSEGCAAFEAAGAAYQALDSPLPTRAAVASGALTVLSQSSSVRIDL